jgi:hypothetical protein
MFQLVESQTSNKNKVYDLNKKVITNVFLHKEAINLSDNQKQKS